MPPDAPPPPIAAARFNRVDAWLFGCLGVVVALYASGSRLTSFLYNHLGPMPVRGGIWSWAWSIDRVGNPAALRLLGLTLVGGVAGAVLGRWPARSRLYRYRVWIWLLVTLAAGLLFFYDRVLVSLGDTLAYQSMANAHVWFKLSQPLSTALFAAAYALLGPHGWPVAASLAVVSCLAGCGWVIVLGLFAQALPTWPARLLLGAGLLAGGVALFFGYLETTIVPIACGGLYLYLGYRALRGHSLLPAGLALGLTLALHGQMLYLLPSFALLAWVAYRRGARWSIALGGLLVVLPAALIVAFALTHPALTLAGFGDALGGGDNRMFIPFFKVEIPTEYYPLFSFNNLTELLNLTLRSAPLLGLLLLPAAVGFWINRRDLEAWFWGLVVAGSLSFVLLWNPDLGMAHDWDLFTPPLMFCLLACAWLWPARWQPRQGAAWTGAALGFSAAALGVTLSYFSPAGTWDLWVNTTHPAQPLAVRYGGTIDLLGYDALAPTYAPGDILNVQLYWRPRAPLLVDYTAGVYLIASTAAGDRVLGQDDHRPVAFIDRYSGQWEPGEVVPDRHALVIPSGTAPGDYALWVVLYDLNTMSRLPVGPEDGPDHLVLATITVP